MLSLPSSVRIWLHVPAVLLGLVLGRINSSIHFNDVAKLATERAATGELHRHRQVVREIDQVELGDVLVRLTRGLTAPS
jgi:hypothetical protein